MSNPDDADDDTKRAIREAARSQPLGDGRGVRCTDCGNYIEPGNAVKGYVVGDARGTRWKLSKVMHPDCGRLFSPENINRNDDTDAIIEGTLVHDPSVSAGQPDETQVTETQDATFIDAPRGTHRLEEPEVQAVNMMSDERREERAETMREAEEMMEKLQSGELDDHPLGDMLGGPSPDDEEEESR